MIGMKAVTTQKKLVHFACDVKYESRSASSTSADNPVEDTTCRAAGKAQKQPLLARQIFDIEEPNLMEKSALDILYH